MNASVPLLGDGGNRRDPDMLICVNVARRWVKSQSHYTNALGRIQALVLLNLSFGAPFTADSPLNCPSPRCAV